MINGRRDCGRDARIMKTGRRGRYSAAIEPPRRWKLSACLFVMLLLSITIGCGSRRGLSIEGVWTDKDRPTARFHFRPDGTVRLTDDCSPVNIDVGSGIDFTWKRDGNDVRMSFRAADRECRAKLEDKLLLVGPTDSMRFGDGHYLSNPRQLTWFEQKR